MKKHSKKFWIIFWSASAIFLAGWFLFWQIKNKGFESVVDNLPVDEKWKTLTGIADYLLAQDDKEKTFLVLFQNNMEIRPGGGYIGSFGIVKMKNGKVSEIQIHDLSNFDERIPDTETPPYPMAETLRIKYWKLRDSNFSPDFPTNAEKAEYFYKLGSGEENFDGVFGITANVLTSFLKATGPIQIEGYPGTYADENAIIALEYQVEKGYYDQGIEKGERKSVMNDLAKEIIKKTSDLSTSQRIELMKIILNDLEKKDIQLFFKDNELQKRVETSSWNGETDKNWDQDYLMIVDANMGAFKSDYYVKRSFEYFVDLSGETPTAKLKITYQHTAQQKDWMTRNYLTYLRVYVPEGSWMTESKNTGEMKFGKELGKTYFGTLIGVPLGQTGTVEFSYALPDDFKNKPYNLKIQKQAGINDVPAKIEVINKDGSKSNYEFTMNSDIILNK